MLAKEIAGLSTSYHIVLVSSGAVGSGKIFIKNYKGSLIERKAAAAIGNPILIQLYHKYFSKYGITVAQALCERHHFSNRAQFLQLKETFFEFWNNNILPVVNENDLVSNVELKFSDNDELATLLAAGSTVRDNNATRTLHNSLLITGNTTFTTSGTAVTAAVSHGPPATPG